MKKALKDLKKGEFFRLVESESAPVWVRGYYVSDEGKKKIEAYKYEDVNCEGFFSPSRIVYYGFTY